jgi:hypothetical protein
VSAAGDCAGSLVKAAAKRTGSRSTVAVVLLVDPDSTNHAPDPTIRTSESQISFDGKYLTAVFAGVAE